MSGQRPYKDIDIIFTGLRAGEKLYEELFYQNEDHNSTQRKKIFLAQSKIFDFSFIQKQIDMLEESLRDNDKRKTLDIILQIVPEANIS